MKKIPLYSMTFVNEDEVVFMSSVKGNIDDVEALHFIPDIQCVQVTFNDGSKDICPMHRIQSMQLAVGEEL